MRREVVGKNYAVVSVLSNLDIPNWAEPSDTCFLYIDNYTKAIESTRVVVCCSKCKMKITAFQG
jgi:hypothetical protein